MKRRVLYSFVAFLGIAVPVLPCECVDPSPPSPGLPAFEQAMAKFPVVVAGSVVAQKGIPSEDPGAAAYIELEVLEVIKGVDLPRRLRIWDATFKSSCNLKIGLFREGSFMAFAIMAYDAENMDDYWDRLFDWSLVPPQSERPHKDDYVLLPCGYHAMPLANRKEVAPFASRARKKLEALSSVPGGVER